MPDLKSLENVELAIFFLVPGVVILFIRSQFLTGRMPAFAEAVMHYFIISLIYATIAYTPMKWFIGQTGGPVSRTFLWLVFTIIAPTAVGLFLGVAVRNDWLYRFAGRIGVRPVHAAPTAWDWFFSRSRECWVVVTLKNGSTFSGWMGRDSFFSSNPSERDIFLSKIYDVDGAGTWIDRGAKSLYIAHGEVQTIEFIALQEPGDQK
jgi:hypothetical protein